MFVNWCTQDHVSDDTITHLIKVASERRTRSASDRIPLVPSKTLEDLPDDDGQNGSRFENRIRNRRYGGYVQILCETFLLSHFFEREKALFSSTKSKLLGIV